MGLAIGLVAVGRDVYIDVNVIYHDMVALTRLDEGVNVTRYTCYRICNYACFAILRTNVRY